MTQGGGGPLDQVLGPIALEPKQEVAIVIVSTPHTLETYLVSQYRRQAAPRAVEALTLGLCGQQVQAARPDQAGETSPSHRCPAGAAGR